MSEKTPDTMYTITWEIDQEGTSPADAVRRVWQETFNRGSAQPSNQEACIFTVTHGTTKTMVDLSDLHHAALFLND